MKFIDADHGGLVTVELTRRNLESLLAKLDDPASVHTLFDGQNKVQVVAVENEEHYSDRAPGPVYMPTSGEFL